MEDLKIKAVRVAQSYIVQVVHLVHLALNNIVQALQALQVFHLVRVLLRVPNNIVQVVLQVLQVRVPNNIAQVALRVLVLNCIVQVVPVRQVVIHHLLVRVVQSNIVQVARVQAV